MAALDTTHLPVYLAAREIWVKAEASRVAYEAAASTQNLFAKGLGWVTVGSAVLAAALAAMPVAERTPKDSLFTWFAIAVAALTALSSVLERVMTPVSKRKALWDCAGKLEAAQGKLVLWALTDTPSAPADAGTLGSISDAIAAAKVEFVVLDQQEMDAAAIRFRGTTLDTVLSRYDGVARPDIPLDALAEDAPGIKAVRRVQSNLAAVPA